MKHMLVLAVLFGFLLIICGIYFLQEKVIFFPSKLPVDFQYTFSQRFEERNFDVEDNIRINALHFKVENPKGLVFYSHGNAGDLSSWGLIAKDFLSNQYDLLIYDYRGYGKSSGKISERNLYNDAEFIYKELLREYSAENIIVYGRSIGTGVASYVASKHHPKLLILESPYLNLPDLAGRIFPILPRRLLRYQFRNDLFIQEATCPVVIFHGTEDEIIPFESSIKLQELFKDGDRLVTIQGGHHNDLSNFEFYHNELALVLK